MPLPLCTVAQKLHKSRQVIDFYSAGRDFKSLVSTNSTIRALFAFNDLQALIVSSFGQKLPECRTKCPQCRTGTAQYAGMLRRIAQARAARRSFPLRRVPRV